MTPIRTADVKKALPTVMRDEVQAAAGNNAQISQAEQAAAPVLVQQAAAEVRAQHPHVTVNAVVDVLVRKGVAAIDGVNTTAKTRLSPAALAALDQSDPEMGARVRKAVDLVLRRPMTGTDVANRLTPLVTNLRFDDLGSEGDQACTVVRVPGPVTALDEASFKTAFGLTAATPDNKVERFVDATAALANFIATNSNSREARTTVDVLKSLRDVKAIVTGEDGTTNALHPAYLVGVASDGQIVGIKTGVVWT